MVLKRLAVVLLFVTLSHGQQTISPISITGQAGENVIIECTSGRPGEAVNNVLRIYRPALDTFESFENSAEAAGRLDRDDSGSLTTYTFGPLRSSDDRIILICTSSGESSGNATIIVSFRANITRGPGSPEQNPLVVKEGESETINLDISVNPQPTDFTWSRNGETVTSGNGLTLTLNSFIVDPAKREHTGTYTLEVTNAAGTGNFTFTLDVQYPPQFQAEYVQPSDSNCIARDNSGGIQMFDCAATVGSPITFLCGATGNPTPIYEHTFAGTGGVAVSGSKIVIRSVMGSSAGNYTCRAISVVFPNSTVTRIFQLFVGGPPQSPGSVSPLIDTDDGEVVFTWEYDDSVNGVPATNFVVTIKLDGQTVFTSEIPADRDRSSYTHTIALSRLMDERMYSVEVVVRNLLGDSSPISQFFTTPSSGGVVVSASFMLSLLLLVVAMLL